MTNRTKARLSQRIADLHASPIREILSVLNQPGMVSFAGGLPSPDSFPPCDLSAVPAEFLQYGASEGELALRSQIASDMHDIGLPCEPSQVLVLSGSQQGIDLVAKLFIDPGSLVALESPTYLAALQVFRFFGARFSRLQALLEAQDDAMQMPKLTYVIPTFQNPSGYCMTAAERDALAQACDRTGTVLFEDDPYRDLVYEPCERTPVCARLDSASWVYQGSFSKTLAPGMRLGFLVASLDLMPYLVRLKQAADLHSNRISQWWVLQQLQDPARHARTQALAQNYRVKRDNFSSYLDHYFKDLASWHVPQGGLFFWLKLKQTLDTRKLLPLALEQQLAFMPGEAFMPEPTAGTGQIRLNFSHATADQTEAGLARLAEVFRRALQAST
jgi:DNA-binding transcriptional MocR family regulator